MLTRRRALTIAAAALACPASARAPLHVETGVALGTRVTLRLSHPDAPSLAAAALTEISRLEDIFSLYRPQSALSRLNRMGQLSAPPPELLECLSLAGAVHQASDGRFDPTVQPIWRLQAAAAEAGHPVTAQARAAARNVVGWSKLTLSPEEITLPQGGALTLNGIAQGYIADRVAAFFVTRGLSDILIDTGELRALGHDPRTRAAWPVRYASGGQTQLAQRALATSSPFGMRLPVDPSQSHILDPRTGHSMTSQWTTISVSSDSAAVADAVSTAACLCETRKVVVELCNRFPTTKLERAL